MLIYIKPYGCSNVFLLNIQKPVVAKMFLKLSISTAHWLLIMFILVAVCVLKLSRNKDVCEVRGGQ